MILRSNSSTVPEMLLVYICAYLVWQDDYRDYHDYYYDSFAKIAKIS